MTSKGDLIEAFSRLIAERIETLESGSASAQRGARVDGTHRPASRGERGAVSEQAALAHGLRQRANQLRTIARLLDDVPRGSLSIGGPGALVCLEDEDEEELNVLILPGGQGDRLGEWVVVSPDSPIGSALCGAEMEDSIPLVRGGRRRFFEVISVR